MDLLPAGDPAEAVNRWEDPSLHELRAQLRTQLKQVRAAAVPERNNPWPYASRRPPEPTKRGVRGVLHRVGILPS